MVRDMIAMLSDVNLFSTVMRLGLALLLGGVLGIERGRRRRPAGLRTYMIVCMASALVMLTGQFLFETFHTGDPSRLGAQVISGIHHYHFQTGEGTYNGCRSVGFCLSGAGSGSRFLCRSYHMRNFFAFSIFVYVKAGYPSSQKCKANQFFCRI